jgi:hypothetical protein
MMKATITKKGLIPKFDRSIPTTGSYFGSLAGMPLGPYTNLIVSLECPRMDRMNIGKASRFAIGTNWAYLITRFVFQSQNQTRPAESPDITKLGNSL